MPRRNNRARRRTRRREIDIEVPTLTTDEMARQLVANGRASTLVLGEAATRWTVRNG